MSKNFVLQNQKMIASTKTSDTLRRLSIVNNGGGHIMIVGLDHIAIAVPDLEKAIKQFCERLHACLCNTNLEIRC